MVGWETLLNANMVGQVLRQRLIINKTNEFSHQSHSYPKKKNHCNQNHITSHTLNNKGRSERRSDNFETGDN